MIPIENYNYISNSVVPKLGAMPPPPQGAKGLLPGSQGHISKKYIIFLGQFQLMSQYAHTNFNTMLQFRLFL